MEMLGALRIISFKFVTGLKHGYSQAVTGSLFSSQILIFVLATSNVLIAHLSLFFQIWMTITDATFASYWVK